jgi:hypothetical protein
LLRRIEAQLLGFLVIPGVNSGHNKRRRLINKIYKLFHLYFAL